MADKEVVADEVEQKPELSIREELEAARDEVVARQEKDNVVSTDESVSARQSEPDSAARIRGPDGKFARQSDAGTGGESAAASNEIRHSAGTAGNNPQSAGASSAQGVVQPVALPAPNGWKA
jgi:hypothetical protein